MSEEFVGFIEFIEFIEFIGFVEFIEFIEFVEVVEFIGFIMPGLWPGRVRNSGNMGWALTEAWFLCIVTTRGYDDG
jgi:hypothetical protein